MKEKEMKLRSLVVLTISIVLGTLFAHAQKEEGARTFTDHLNQSITISRFGTVLSFKNSNGKETAATNVYRVCPCGEQSGCLESATVPAEKTSSTLEVSFPKKGATLRKGETLSATATFNEGDLRVKRRLNWEAGTGTLVIDEIISSSKPLCSSTLERKPGEGIPVVAFEMKMCPGPPEFWSLTCPPFITPEAASRSMRLRTVLRASK
jgi:hypothetical protein